MRVFIANFGMENWAWRECFQKPALAVMYAATLDPFWETRDKEGYIKEAQRLIRQPDGRPIIRGVASRWFNVNDIFFESSGDYWIHREKDELWWTVSSDQPAYKELRDEPTSIADQTKFYICFKPCAPWSDKDRHGGRLRWSALHARAKEFLFTEATCQQLSDDNAAYAEALISGESLLDWHNRSDWKARSASAKSASVTHFSPRKKTIARMATTAFETAMAGGTSSLVTKKEKEFRFNDKYELEKYIDELFDNQEGLCALSGMQMVYDGDEGNPEFVCSLDRIDSHGHYERGNLQVVCKFANRWKGDTDNNVFLGLIRSVVDASTTVKDVSNLVA